MNNTLSFLISGSLTPSPAQSYTQTSAFLQHTITQSRSFALRTAIAWDPLKPQHAMEAWKARVAKEQKAGERKSRIERIKKAGAWEVIAETRQMAEGMGGIMLGRTPGSRR